MALHQHHGGDDGRQCHAADDASRGRSRHGPIGTILRSPWLGAAATDGSLESLPEAHGGYLAEFESVRRPPGAVDHSPAEEGGRATTCAIAKTSPCPCRRYAISRAGGQRRVTLDEQLPLLSVRTRSTTRPKRSIDAEMPVSPIGHRTRFSAARKVLTRQN